MAINLLETSGIIANGVIFPIQPSTGYEETIGVKTKLVGTGNTSINFPFISNLSTMAKVGQTWNPQRHNQTFDTAFIRAPVYQLTAEFSTDLRTIEVTDKNLGGRINTINILKESMAQAIKMKARIGYLHGFQKGEGILANASTFSFGNDTNNNTTASTYNPSWFADRIVEMGRKIMSATNNTAEKLVILTSIRMANLIKSKVVDLLNSQKDGGGVDSIGGLAERIAYYLGVSLEIHTDNTLENASADGVDTLVMVAPRIKSIDRGAFGSLNVVADGISDINNACTAMDTGAGDAVYYPYPDNYNGAQTMGGALVQMISTGVVLREEAVIKAEITYANS